MIRPLPFFALSALLLLLAGCGGTKYQPVTGQLVFPDGSPVTELEGGQVVFEAQGEGGTPVSASGALDSKGRFTLGTESVSDGATAGMNKVAITPPAATGDVPPPAVIHPKYERFETSGLQYEVKPGKNDFKIKVEKP